MFTPVIGGGKTRLKIFKKQILWIFVEFVEKNGKNAGQLDGICPVQEWVKKRKQK